MISRTIGRSAALGAGVLAMSFAATMTAGGAQAVSIDHADLYVTSTGTPCQAVIGVTSFGTPVDNVHLHALGGVDLDQGTIQPHQPIEVAVPGCIGVGSSSFQLVWVTGDGSDASPFDNAAFV